MACAGAADLVADQSLAADILRSARRQAMTHVIHQSGERLLAVQFDPGPKRSRFDLIQGDLDRCVRGVALALGDARGTDLWWRAQPNALKRIALTRGLNPGAERGIAEGSVCDHGDPAVEDLARANGQSVVDGGSRGETVRIFLKPIMWRRSDQTFADDVGAENACAEQPGSSWATSRARVLLPLPDRPPIASSRGEEGSSKFLPRVR